jgi:hypothetical protein
LQRAFPLDVSMVPSSMLIVTADGEHLTCGGFSLGETVLLGSFEFIADYFGGLGLSPRRNNSYTTFMGSTHCGSPSPRWAMMEDSTEEFHMMSSGDGGFGLPSSRRCGTGALPAPITTKAWMETAPATQALMTVPLWAAVPRSDIDLPIEQWHDHQEGQ